MKIRCPHCGEKYEGPRCPSCGRITDHALFDQQRRKVALMVTIGIVVAGVAIGVLVISGVFSSLIASIPK